MDESSCHPLPEGRGADAAIEVAMQESRRMGGGPLFRVDAVARPTKQLLGCGVCRPRLDRESGPRQRIAERARFLASRGGGTPAPARTHLLAHGDKYLLIDELLDVLANERSVAALDTHPPRTTRGRRREPGSCLGSTWPGSSAAIDLVSLGWSPLTLSDSEGSRGTTRTSNPSTASRSARCARHSPGRRPPPAAAPRPFHMDRDPGVP